MIIKDVWNVKILMLWLPLRLWKLTLLEMWDPILKFVLDTLQDLLLICWLRISRVDTILYTRFCVWLQDAVVRNMYHMLRVQPDIIPASIKSVVINAVGMACIITHFSILAVKLFVLYVGM